MKKTIPLLFICCLAICQSVTAQNLVPNPSFEDTIQANGQPGLDTWQKNIGTPDYFSDYFVAPFDNRAPSSNFRGGEPAKEGVATFGFAVLDQRRLNAREYMQTKLLDTLVAGQQYEVQFYISLADSFHWALAANNIGIHFNDAVYPNNFDHAVREFRPYFTSDTTWNASNKNGWEKFHYTYTAQGGENTLVIGCFLNDQEITIDSVGNGGDFPLAEKGSYYFIDNISVTLKDTSTSIVEHSLVQQIKHYPNPAKNDLFLEYKGKERLLLQLFDLKGQEIKTKIERNSSQYHLRLSNLPAGIYLLKASDGKSQSTFKILKQ